MKRYKIKMQTVFLIKVHLFYLSGLDNSRSILMTEGRTAVRPQDDVISPVKHVIFIYLFFLCVVPEPAPLRLDLASWRRYPAASRPFLRITSRPAHKMAAGAAGGPANGVAGGGCGGGARGVRGSRRALR